MKNLLPTPKQLEFMDWEFGVFFHFGIRSFFKGHKDWDDRPMPASAFCPDSLDCGQWIRAARDAGARYAILVCKHHDGFANWPSRYTDYSAAASPYNGDVVRAFTDACREYGLKAGLYYSPAQWGGSAPFEDARAYDDYFIAQISELLSDYGRIDYLWFDGCGSDGHEYDRERIIRAIRALQPDILLFEMWDPDTRWIGNEDGYADMDNPNTAGGRFLPAECDCMLRDTWFDCEDNERAIKSVEELIGMYELSVGRGANFLLNIGPNRHGLLNEADERRLREFGAALKARYGAPVPGFGAMEDDLSIRTAGYLPEQGNTAETALVNRLVIEEDMSEGGHVREFSVWADLPSYRSQRICVYRGRTIGHKAICVFPTVRTGRLTVEIVRADGTPRLKAMRAYRAKQA